MDKHRERVFVETTRKLYPWFPPGDLVEYEKPDILLVDGDDRTGIEVTELFRPPIHGSKFGPHVVGGFHRRIMRLAEDRARSLPPLDVAVYFEYEHRLNDEESCAKTLIEFVRAHGCGTYDASNNVPYGFSVIRIAEPRANEIPRWQCWDSGETLVVSRDQLAVVIADKNRLVASYRVKVSRVWLLIACSFSDFANNFSVPDDIDKWRFDHDFDKVLLLSSERGVFNLLRRDTSTSVAPNV